MARIRLAPGNRLSSEVGFAHLGNIALIGDTTHTVRVTPLGVGDVTLLDLIQGPESVIGIDILNQPQFGTFDHFLDANAPATNITTPFIPPYQSYLWWGLVDNVLTWELHDARHSTQRISPNTITVSAPDPLPENVCSHCAWRLRWREEEPGEGLIELFINGVMVASEALPTPTIRETSGAGFVPFHYDFMSIAVGESFQASFHPSTITVELSEYYIFYGNYGPGDQYPQITDAQILALSQDCPGPSVIPFIWFQWDGTDDVTDRNGVRFLAIDGEAEDALNCPCDTPPTPEEDCPCIPDTPTDSTPPGVPNDNEPPNQFPIIGEQLVCMGGGLVPTQADIVPSELWWGL